ncbi:hypothetical protein ACJMK2_006714 [Sinanodonta woodiana]|uniref:J domain-containing protein n=1 Tax=Sinanodonta woodiana TaxID=1069815 RepID=A0ABD3VVM5_SINWO
MSLTLLWLICTLFSSVTSDFVDHYATLGLSRDAERNEIRSAYTRLVKIYHPDKRRLIESRDESKQFLAVQEAYEVLRDSVKRETYDRHYPDAGKSWWNSLRSDWNELAFLRRRNALQNSIIQALHEIFYKYQILTFHFIRYVVNELPIFMSKLKSATDDWTHAKSVRWTGFRSETYARPYHKKNWWIPEYGSLKGSFRDFLMVLGLSSACLISKYLSRLKIVKAVSFPFCFNTVIFPVWLTVYLPWLVMKKLPWIFALVLVFIQISVYKTFARKILSDILQNVDEGVKNHEKEIFYYILVATIVSFPVFNKYRHQIHLFTRICICAVIHIATCVAVFKAMIFKDAVSFFVCLTLLIILIDKFPITITVFLYLLIQIISGNCLDVSPILFTITITLGFISWPISYLFEGSRRSSLYYLKLLWFQQFLAGADHVGETEQEEQIQEKDIITLRQEISFYFGLTFSCIFVMFVYEFY